MTRSVQFPFTAVTGQALFKKALLLNAVNPAIGGVLVKGPRGVAKSTLARSLADLLHEGELVTLPLGTSEDMLLGSLNLEQVLQQQQVSFQPGLLSRAHQGVLYVDEVNLLNDHLTDLLLDVAASGVNRVERDGVSHEHVAQFILLGTMNPDEGELRGQLQDRFGLALTLSNQYDIAERVEIVRLREAFQRDAQAFCLQYAAQQQQLKQQLMNARELLPNVNCDDSWRIAIAERCAAAHVDGLRADIVWLQAALAHAALAGRDQVQSDDLSAVEELVLHHRRKEGGGSSNSSSRPGGGSQNDDQEKSRSSHGFRRPPDTRQTGGSSNQSDTPQTTQGNDWGELSPADAQLNIQKTVTDGEHSFLEPLLSKVAQENRSAASRAITSKGKGQGALGTRLCRANSGSEQRSSVSIDWVPSLVKAARLESSLKKENLVLRQPEQRADRLHIVLLDTSASVLKNQQFGRAKACIVDLAKQVYLKREQFVLFGFGHNGAEQLLTPRRAPKTLQHWLDTLKAGGGTPFRDLLEQVQSLQSKQLKQSPGLQFTTYILSDGRYRQSVNDLTLQGATVFIDTEQTTVKRGRGEALAQELQADYYPLSSL